MSHVKPAPSLSSSAAVLVLFDHVISMTRSEWLSFPRSPVCVARSVFEKPYCRSRYTCLSGEKYHTDRSRVCVAGRYRVIRYKPDGTLGAMSALAGFAALSSGVSTERL